MFDQAYGYYLKTYSKISSGTLMTDKDFRTGSFNQKELSITPKVAISLATFHISQGHPPFSKSEFQLKLKDMIEDDLA